MIELRPMQPGDVNDATALAAQSVSGPPRSPLWWWAHPTVVALDGLRVVGFASFSISLPPTPDLADAQQTEIGLGHGMAVDPAYQGQGLGQRLADYRNDVMRDLGLRFFIGHAHPTNAAMQAIFARHGLQATVTARSADGSDVMLYMGSVA